MTDTHTTGHNNPPVVLPTAAEVADDLRRRHAELIATARAWYAIGLYVPRVIALDDIECLSLTAAYVRGVRAFNKKVGSTRTEERALFTALASAPQDVFSPVETALDNRKSTAEEAINSYNNRKEAHERELRAQAAKRARDEADAIAATAGSLEDGGHDKAGGAVMDAALSMERMADKMDRQSTGNAADLVRTQTAGGTTSSKGEWDFEITDRAALNATMGKLAEHFAVAAIESAIRSFRAMEKKAGRVSQAQAPVLPGVTFTWSTKAIVR